MEEGEGCQALGLCRLWRAQRGGRRVLQTGFLEMMMGPEVGVFLRLADICVMGLHGYIYFFSFTHTRILNDKVYTTVKESPNARC